MTHSLLCRFPSPREIERFDFEDGNGPVPAHRHPNFGGVLGGWVAETADVARTARVGATACVFGAARVLNKARVSGHAKVFGDASLVNEAHVYGSAQVFGRAKLWGKPRVYGHARVFGQAAISEDARVCGTALLDGAMRVLESAWVEKPEDVRVGPGWTAARTFAAFKLYEHKLYEHIRTTTFSSWDELPRVLLDRGLISAMEYLALAAETDSQAPGER